MHEPYLTTLTTTLLDRMERVPAAVKERTVGWLRSVQQPDGGFAGRAGGSDLYYTTFALRTLAVTQSLEESLCQRVGDYLRECRGRSATPVDFFSWLMAAYIVPVGGGPDLLAEAP
ncbi:MAG: prenyltransferase/squalene oxidase repeat-containing protein, partial [Gemmataceae bacterium]